MKIFQTIKSKDKRRLLRDTSIHNFFKTGTK